MTTTTDETPALAEVEFLLRHAACLERAAANPDACPKVAARCLALAALFRAAALTDTQESPRDH